MVLRWLVGLLGWLLFRSVNRRDTLEKRVEELERKVRAMEDAN
jgi:hypothetical protein